MLQAVGRTRLAPKPRDETGILLQITLQDLDRRLAAQRLVLGQENLAHPIGCCKRLVARASRRNRVTKLGSCSRSRCRILIAALRPNASCSARKTSPIRSDAASGWSHAPRAETA